MNLILTGSTSLSAPARAPLTACVPHRVVMPAREPLTATLPAIRR